MRHLIYILIITIFSFQTYGQVNGNALNVKAIANDFLKNGIDTFLIQKDDYIGAMKSITINRDDTKEQEIEKWCNVSDKVYILFQKKDTLYLQKINECYTYKPIRLDSSKALVYFIKHFDTIALENILPNTVEITNTGDTLSVWIDHTHTTDFFFSFGNKRKEIYVDWFCFAEIATSRKNIFYEHNSRTKIKKVDELFRQDLAGRVFEKK